MRDAFSVQEDDGDGDGDGDGGVEGLASGVVAEYLQNKAARNFFQLMTDTDTLLYPAHSYD